MASIRLFAGAAEAAATDATTVNAATIGDLRTQLVQRYGTEFARVLGLCSLLVNGSRAADDEAPLADTDSVDVLPPFAGG
ncbi:MoaD/ThiS family protein [Cryobacterium sp. CG_9.6]|uniref:MoaD/ThiS family protein n=1 Tax=Cryobacterium sp. CG_9.6 TaxID=2760710 RepID=UPI002473877E|nr:MoaD/ThiS family protein [Cryobacterium sp. CG_9.6]MDH6235768.1 molybdopterin converting factor small subunit [Cryobacterium sp. CG_9.6]